MIDFDFAGVTTVEFGVGLDTKNGQELRLVPVDNGVQQALTQMALATEASMGQRSANPMPYQPSELYGSAEHLCLQLQDNLAEQVRLIHQATNVPIDTAVLSKPSEIFCYFAYLADQQGRRMTGIRRSTQFKGVLKSRLVRLFTDTLKIVEDKIFKLDQDFDLLVSGSSVYILRPNGFEFVGRLQSAVLNSVCANVRMIREDLQYIDFAAVEDYASSHPRAARYLASIRVQKETRNIDKQALVRLCRRTGVAIKDVAGKITVEPGHVLGFLEVLDRRRYEVELVKDVHERFRASSRQRLGSRTMVGGSQDGTQKLVTSPIPMTSSEETDY